MKKEITKENQQLDSTNSRRTLLKGLGSGLMLSGLASAALAKTRSQEATAKTSTKALEKEKNSMVAACENKLMQSVPFRGKHQAGIITPEPAEAIFIAFSVVAKDLNGLRDMFKRLTTRIDFLTKANKQDQPQTNKRFPPVNSGILGPHIYPDNLTVTVSLGSTLFEKAKYGLKKLKPKQLTIMPPFPNDALDKDWCDGDLVLQICGNTRETVIYAVRDIIKYTPDVLVPKWKMDGFLPARDICMRNTAINLLGFKDGTGNASNKDDKLMNELVWVGKNNGEPEWAWNGSYQAIRLIRFFVEFWDRTPLGEQEEVNFGRKKMSGAPLGKSHEFDDPEFNKDPDGEVTSLTTHIRRAEPRSPERHVAKLRRRSYSYSLGLRKNGHLDMGLNFVCYQNSLADGFISTQNRLNGEDLEEYIQPFGGGYFYALPGVSETGYIGQSLIEAAEKLQNHKNNTKKTS